MLNAIVFIITFAAILAGMFWVVFHSRKTTHHTSIDPSIKALDGIAVGDRVGYRSRKHGHFSGLNLRLGQVVGFAASRRAFVRLEDNGYVVRRQLDRLSVVSS